MPAQKSSTTRPQTLGLLRGKTVAVIGYVSQGHARRADLNYSSAQKRCGLALTGFQELGRGAEKERAPGDARQHDAAAAGTW